MSHYLGNVSIQHNPRVRFGVIIDTKGAVLLMIHKKICISFLPFIFIWTCGRVKAAAEPQELSNLDLNIGNFNRISRLMRYGKLNCINFFYYYLQ